MSYNFFAFFITASKFLLSISTIVSIHELGHLLFAKLFGISVNEYMIGLPPKLAGFRKGETYYGVGLLPLGGYVRIEGFIEGEDSYQGPRSFQQQAIWKRLLIIMGGILFNFLSALLIFTAITYLTGSHYLSTTEVNKHGILPTEAGHRLGFQSGDKIVAVNGASYHKFEELLTLIHQGVDVSYNLKRGNEIVVIHLPATEALQLKASKQLLFTPRIPYSIQSVKPNSPAAKAGLQPGDRLITIDGQPVYFFDQLESCLKVLVPNKPAAIAYWRGNEKMNGKLTLTTDKKLGITTRSELAWTHEPCPSLYVAMAKAGLTTQGIIAQQLRGFKAIITGKASISQSLSGPIGLAQLFGESTGIIALLTLIALLSLLIGCMNLLPIPGLDGFHGLVLLLEGCWGKRLTPTVKMRLLQLGNIILLALMIFVVLNDLYKLCGLPPH